MTDEEWKAFWAIIEKDYVIMKKEKWEYLIAEINKAKVLTEATLRACSPLKERK